MRFKESCNDAYARLVIEEALIKEIATRNMAERSRARFIKDFKIGHGQDVKIVEALSPNNCLLQIEDLNIEVLETIMKHIPEAKLNKNYDYKLTYFCEVCGDTSHTVILKHTFDHQIELGRALYNIEKDHPRNLKYCGRCGWYDPKTGIEVLRGESTKY